METPSLSPEGVQEQQARRPWSIPVEPLQLAAFSLPLAVVGKSLPHPSSTAFAVMSISFSKLGLKLARVELGLETDQAY